MLGWFDQSVCPIGIDLGTQSIKMVQLRYRRGHLTMQAAGRMDLPFLEDPVQRSTAVTAAVRQILESAPFAGRRCVTCLPTAQVQARSLRLPSMPEPELAQAVGWEARDRLGFDPADGQLAFFRAGEVRRGTEVRDELLLFGASGDSLRAHIHDMTEAGLKIDAIDLQACAMQRSLYRAGAASGGHPLAIMDIGASGTQLVIAPADRLAFYKHIDIGVATLDQAIAQKLGVAPVEAGQIRARMLRGTAEDASQENATVALEQAVLDAIRAPLEELGRELDMCVRYFVVSFRETRPDSLTLVGGQGQAARLIEMLSANLGMPVEVGQPLRGVACLTESTRSDRSSPWAVAAGLSLYDDATTRQEAA